LYTNDQKKYHTLAQELTNVTMQLTVRNEAMKEVQSALQDVYIFCGQKNKQGGHMQSFTRIVAVATRIQ
jgi:hypothetical protein